MAALAEVTKQPQTSSIISNPFLSAHSGFGFWIPGQGNHLESLYEGLKALDHPEKSDT